MNLAKARRLILKTIPPPATETVPLAEALGRIAARPIKAGRPSPPFPQAARDGYAVCSRDLAGATGQEPVPLTLAGQVAAGCTAPPTLQRGKALAIMTGAMVPAGADQVVPFEECRQRDGQVLPGAPAAPGRWIRPRGGDLAAGRTIISRGREILVDHLPMLAAAGIPTAEVFVRPRIGILCTGSELIEPETSPAPGQIASGNQFLLHGLLTRAGVIPVDLGLAPDRLPALTAALDSESAQGLQAIITTGGMGPGKYDLVARALTEAGIDILYQSLRVRPGKATLFGIRGNTLFFGLPGPPPAARLLFHELIDPALIRLRGSRQKTGPVRLRVGLAEEIRLKKSGATNLKGGALTLHHGAFRVRPAGRIEPINAIIHIPAGRRHLRRGETVTVSVLDLSPA